MSIFVSADWVEQRLDSREFLLLDPRRPVRYLQGHLRNAVNLPVSGAFDPQGSLLPVDRLAGWLGAAGLDDRKTPVMYDAHDGRHAAMLVWILEYLGRTDVHIMDVFLEKWMAQGREIFYRPVKPAPGEFSARVNPAARTALKDLRDSSGRKLVDFRSPEEYTGKLATDEPAGHIPGAVNIVWQDLVGEDHQFLAPAGKLQRLLATAGIAPRDRVVAYCGAGLRAALGYVALKQLGVDVSLYDGSYAEWARRGLPVETSEAGAPAARRPTSRPKPL